ncbi:MAG TPA: hypothetical protein VFB67_01305 [Candidatus Polarisedimenticolaceae bacterium]|nr:hypothetical protein [Candidatus Polarisedimenticolaceae bacterium]
MASRTSAIATVALSALAAASAVAAPREHGPVPLYQPPLDPPSDGAAASRPTVRARLSIDATGRVTRVDVTGLDPAPPGAVDAYKAAARAGFSAWRFAPAEKEGRAIASETLVAILFDRGGPPSSREAQSRYLWISSVGSGFESSRYDERARILSMGEAERRAYADRIAERAERLIPKDKRAVASDDGFQVVTDFGGPKQAEALLRNLEATYGALEKLLGARITPYPRRERIRVYVFERNAPYQALCASALGFEWSEGFYSAAGILAFHTEHPTVGRSLSVMLHETTHAFMDRHLVRPGVDLPRWLAEGFAEYIGVSDIQNERIVPGGHERKQELGAGPGEPLLWQTGSRYRSLEAKRAQEEDRALTLAEIVEAGPERFYGKEMGLYYAQGWLAVHFLRHGRPEWADSTFPRFLLYTAEGYPASDALRASYGVGPAELEAEYRRYVTSF